MEGWYHWWLTTGPEDWGSAEAMEFLSPRDLHLLIAMFDRFWTGSKQEMLRILHGTTWPVIKDHLEEYLLAQKGDTGFDTSNKEVMYEAWFDSLSEEDKLAEQEDDTDMKETIGEFMNEWKDGACTSLDSLFWLIRGRAFTEVIELHHCWMTLNVAGADIRQNNGRRRFKYGSWRRLLKCPKRNVPVLSHPRPSSGTGGTSGFLTKKPGK